MPLGVVTLSETFGGGSDERAYAAMVSHAVERLAEANRLPASAHGHNGPGLQMLGTSGTVTTLAAVHLGLRRYDRRKVDGISLPFSVIQSVSRMLRELDDAARAAHPCIGHDRADLVVAGCAILEAVHRCWPVERLQVADRGLREGILNALLGHTLGPGPAAHRSLRMTADRPLKTRVLTARGRTTSSQQWLRRQLNDPFVHQARQQGWRARSVFKLKELDERFELLRRGARVIDLGAAPGSWTQYAVKRGCRVVAVDLLPVQRRGRGDPDRGRFPRSGRSSSRCASSSTGRPTSC